MDIIKQIIDQRLTGIIQDNPDWFSTNEDQPKKKSKAFTCLGVAAYLDVDLSEAESEYYVDGGGDAGIDAIYISDEKDYEFQVILFQTKYVNNLDKDSNFPANSIQKMIAAVASVFDPSKDLQVNEKLAPRINDIRSLILDGYIPSIKCVMVNNGLKWTQEGDDHIVNSRFPSEQVEFEHYAHTDIIKYLQSKKKINTQLQFSGLSIQEDYNFKRVIIGKLNVRTIARLFDEYGDALLERNIRRYLGLKKNRVNESIRKTLLGSDRDNFYFYNNGVTMSCTKFNHNALQEKDWMVNISNLQIINGGQSCKTIQQSINELPEADFSNVFVLVRLYELGEDDYQEGLITDVTIATNSQSPVDLRDLRANDRLQRQLSLAIQDLGYTYKTKKDVLSTNETTILSSVAAEAVSTVWRSFPHIAKFKRSELFGKYYDYIFRDLNGAQLILAVLIFRYCDAQRKRDERIRSIPHLSYSYHFVAMLIGSELLRSSNIQLEQLTHQNYQLIKHYFEVNRENLFDKACTEIEKALNSFYPQGYQQLDKRRLSATFRRGDLLTEIRLS